MAEFKNLSNNAAESEAKVAKYWDEINILKRTVDDRQDAKPFIFFEGPPTANGRPGIHHVMARALKDAICRYKTMEGYQVKRKAGWDTHGLPVEIEVEKKLGLHDKNDIEVYGIKEFCEKCRESVFEYEGMWREMTKRMAYLIDLEHPYITLDNNYIESAWWALDKFFKANMMYEGHKILPYCTRCGTGLASHEVAQGYKEIKTTSVTVTFKRKDHDEYFLVWTTTPWTLPSNAALTVHPDVTYIKAKKEDKVYYICKALASKALGDDYAILEEMTGKELEYIEYEQLMPFVKADKKAFFVTCADYVTTEDGTGIVHTAGAFGDDDYATSRRYGLPILQPVAENGLFTTTPWEGKFVMDADPDIIEWLYTNGVLFKKEKILHNYPHCWRCGTPLLYYARESWFIRMTDVKEDLIRNNAKINWIPESIGKGRFGDWLENVQDWALSRNRYWGTPLNIWVCDDCGETMSIGSKEELREKADNCTGEIELHKPYVDNVTITCPHCGKTMHRVPEVIDCWFDSGSMPFAQHHYPFENQELFHKQFPASFISEAVDQTRGWFYSLHAISTLLFNEPCFENCIILGLVQDENGQKMSKSKGNAVDPMEMLGKYGADAIRWYFIVNSAPWLPSRFYDKAVQEGKNKFLGTLWNTYAFYVLYANIDNFDPTKYQLEYEKLSVMDKWILSKLNSTVKDTDGFMDSYRVTEAGKALQSFVDDLSNWYVRRCRSRYWAPGMEQDKINAYMTLYTCLVTVSKLAAPMIPFMTEEIYQNLVRSVDASAKESIHLTDYPTADESMIDKDLEANMEHVLEAVVLGRAARNESGIKNRQPIGKMYIQAPFEIPEFYSEIILDELNIKRLEMTESAEQFVTYTFKPQMRTVGPKYGKLLGKIKAALSELDGSAAMKELKETGLLKLVIDGTNVDLTEEDLLIDTAQSEDYETMSDGTMTVVLDRRLTPELIEEGFVRELVSKIQTMRKEAGFEVMDRISVYAQGNEKLQKILSDHEEDIKKDVLADAIVFHETDGYVKDWKINGEAVTLAVKKQ